MGCKSSKKTSEVGFSLRENPENIVFHSLGILDVDAYYGKCEEFLWEIRSIYNSLLSNRETLYAKLSLYSTSHRPTPELSIKALVLCLHSRKEQVEFTEKLPFIQSTSGFEGFTAYLDFVNCLLLSKNRLETVYIELGEKIEKSKQIVNEVGVKAENCGFDLYERLMIIHKAAQNAHNIHKLQLETGKLRKRIKIQLEKLEKSKNDSLEFEEKLKGIGQIPEGVPLDEIYSQCFWRSETR